VVVAPGGRLTCEGTNNEEERDAPGEAILLRAVDLE
jgi:hypothetical protein